MLDRIYKNLQNSNINEAFDLIIKYEKQYENNSTYWVLRAKLCIDISEYETALLCCERAINVNSKNTYAISSAIAICSYLQKQDLYEKYLKMLSKVKESLYSTLIDKLMKDLNITQDENNIDYVNEVLKTEREKIFYLSGDMIISNDEYLHIINFNEMESSQKESTIVVPLNENYIESVNTLIKYNILCFSVAIIYSGKLYLIKIDEGTFNQIKCSDRNSTIAFHYLNESDSNVYSLYKNIPIDIDKKFKKIILRGNDDFNLKNMATIPLMAKYSVCGQGTFSSYPCPTLMHNIELGNGAVPFKCYGMMDNKKDPDFMYDKYENIDTYCASSSLDMTLLTSFTHINKEKFLISGIPRTDLLLSTKGIDNLERILGRKLKDKKIIFNMPTCRIDSSSGRIDGNKDLDNFIKINDFDYEKFDEFLTENNYICVLKSHDLEVKKLYKDSNKFNSIFIISNEDLSKYDLDLYEVLNSGDLLLTDYSSIYGDFLFMNKPVVFINTDMDEYSKNRGIALEPYDFWTAGPKVQNQEDLFIEIKKSLEDDNYYSDKRNELRKVYHKYLDGKSCERIWNYIDTELYSQDIKEKIKILIDNNDITEAKRLLQVYKDSYKCDTEIFSMSGIVNLNENNLEESLEDFKKGLEIEDSNVDLLYNMGYLYNLLEDYDKAIYYYEKCILVTNDDNLINELCECINIIKGNFKNKKNTVILLDNQEDLLEELINTEYEVINIIENDSTICTNYYKDKLKTYEINRLKIEKILSILIKTNKNSMLIYNDIKKSSILDKFKEEVKIIYSPNKNYYVDKSNYINHSIDMFMEKEACNKADFIIAKDINIYNSKIIIEQRENVYLLDGKVGDICTLTYILQNYSQIDNKSISNSIKCYLECIEEEYLKSLYYIASENDNTDNLIEIIKYVYKKYNTEEVYQLYITILSRLKNYKDLMSVFQKSNYYEDVYKCELLYLNSQEEYELIDFLINVVIKNYSIVEQMINDNQLLYKMSFYNFELKRYKNAFEKYIEMLNSNSKLSKSPLVNRNISYLMYASDNKNYMVYYNTYNEINKALEQYNSVQVNDKDVFEEIFECLKEFAIDN